jgi:ABC-type uncharacterized transport system YnjBCD substrate-binding protein
MHRLLGLVLLGLAACRSPARAPSIDPLTVPFDKVVEGARGKTVRWFFWSGDGTINRYVDEYVIPTVNQRFGITLVRVPVDDPAIAINRLLAEKRAGKTDGVVDLLWVNGENFRTGKAEGLFFGSFASRLPNLRFVDGQDQAVRLDFLHSPEAQLKKQDPAIWGTHSVLDVQRLPPEVRAQFLAQPRGPATLSPAELRANALPELDPSWIDRLEASWREAQRAPH